MNRERLLILMLLLTGTVVSVAMAANYLINPYGVWSSGLIDPVYRRVTDNRAQMPYLLRSAKPATLLVGTSRVLLGMPIEQGCRDGVLNAGLGGGSMPQVSGIVNAALDNPQLKRIVWGVDFFQFDSGFNHDQPEMRARIQGSGATRIEDTLLSLDTLGDAADVIVRAFKGRRLLPPLRTAPIPWPTAMICWQFASEHYGLAKESPALIRTQLTQSFPGLYVHYDWSPALFGLFRSTVDRARARQVEVRLFIPPMNQYELELIRQRKLWPLFLETKRMLASVGPFVDFSGYNQIARHDDLFIDVMHMKPPAGNQVLRIMLGMEPARCNPLATIVAESAMRVDAKSIDSAIAAQEAMRESAAIKPSRYMRRAAEAIDPARQPD
ncbi:MAG: hypothetical protein IVW54_03070 [Candidatus Binataceae bacterium]|nr:hypothetical protein [Candidatus Binataceae bacterium]